MSILRVDTVPRAALCWLAGSAALAIGVAVYLFDRAAPASWLLPQLPPLAAHPVFGAIGGWLPSLVHPLAFSLFCAALLDPSPRWQYGACAFWFAVNAAFEIGQHPGVRGALAGALRQGIGEGAIARRIEQYFERGTFDPADLAAAALGAALAALLLHRCLAREAVLHGP